MAEPQELSLGLISHGTLVEHAVFSATAVVKTCGIAHRLDDAESEECPVASRWVLMREPNGSDG